MSTPDIVQKLWNLCNVLRDDGITYHQYVTELTYILFLKMLEETGEESALQKDIGEAYKKRLEKYSDENGKTVDELTEVEKESQKTVLDRYSWAYLAKLNGLELKKYYNAVVTKYDHYLNKFPSKFVAKLNKYKIVDKYEIENEKEKS